jgi:predicted naringenin-chalcone synthase
MLALGLTPSTQRIQVGFMGCHGAINGLRVASALTAADPTARVLLVAVELCSLHYRFHWDSERIIANALFGDGAAAVVLGGERPAQQNTPHRNWNIAATGSTLIPDSQDAMTWRIGDHGFEMTLHGRVPDLIQQHLRPWLTQWLAERGHTLDSIGSWAIHPGGPRILSAIEESLGLPRDATAVSREILTSFGNMSSPTVLFIVDRLRQQNAPLPCVALGFGPGMFAEAALFT